MMPALFLIELHVADWPRAVDWYRDVLGLRLVLEDEPNRYALLEGGSGRIALKGDESPGGRGGVRLVFRVDDLDAERARLAGLGVAVGEPVENREEGFRFVRLADPEGTPIRLFAWGGAGPAGN